MGRTPAPEEDEAHTHTHTHMLGGRLTIEILPPDRVPEGVEDAHGVQTISVRPPTEAGCSRHDHGEIMETHGQLRGEEGGPEAKEFHQEVQGRTCEFGLLVCVHADFHERLHEPRFHEPQENHDNVAV